MTGELLDSGEALTFHSERFDQNIYHEVTCKARLREVRLLESNYYAKMGIFLTAESSSDLRQAYSGEPAQHTYSVDRGVVAGSYRWSAEVKNGRTKALKINTEYFVLYNGLINCPEEYVQLYFKKIARFATYPYFRAHFAVHVSSSGLTLAPLPSLNERVD